MMRAVNALLPLLCVALAWGEAPQYSETCGINSFDSAALSFITTSLALVSLAIALTYMYSKIKQDEASSVWAKDEAQNLLITSLLFVGLLAFFTGSCKIAEAYAKGNPFSVSRSYINALLQNRGLGIIASLTRESIEYQEKATSYLYTGMTPFFGSGVQDKAAAKALSTHREFLMDIYIPILASLNAQKFILDAIEWFAARILLPFAFVLRIIPQTREFGNMLIAAFFALYIVVPTLYAMSGATFGKIMAKPESEILADPSLDIFASYSFGSQKQSLFYNIGLTIPQAVFIPNLVIVVAITCAMSLSKALRAVAV